MPNYFTGNPDLVFHFSKLSLEETVALLEEDYTQSQRFELAPHSYEDAMDTYRSALELVGALAGNSIEPRAMEVDREGARLVNGDVVYAKGSQASIRELAESGLMGVIIPREYGGANFPATIYMMMIEMISRADASLMTMFGYQDVGEAIAMFGTKEQAMSFLPKYAAGEHIGSMVLTEPHAGSDLATTKVQAIQDDNGQWRLRGVKRFISNGCGQVLFVLARSEADSKNMFGLSTFAVHRDESVKISRIEEKTGLHGSPTCELVFEDTPAELIGQRRCGLIKYVLHTLNHARFSVAAQGLGIAEAALEEALKWAKERVAFGSAIYEKPQIKNMLLNMRVEVERCRAMLYHAVQLLDLRNRLEQRIERLKAEQRPFAAERSRFAELARLVDVLSPMVKYVVTESANRVCYDAVQIHGGMGYIRETKVERLARDVRITNIYEGTSQIQIISSAKGVMADVLKDFIEAREAKSDSGAHATLMEMLKRMRRLFLESLEFVRKHEDRAFRDVALKELVDTYAALYAGHLLVEDASTTGQKAVVATRFIRKALSESEASLARLRNGEYTDLSQAGVLFGGVD